MWDANRPVDQGRHLTKMIRSGRLRALPRKGAMLKAGPDALLEGWLPAEPLIHEDTRVIAMGSCFAALFTQWLAANGFNSHLDRDDDSSLLRNPLESPVAVAQQFRWAFGELASDQTLWFGTEGEHVEATEEARLELHETLQTADVTIITLGLAECWFDTVTGEPLWRIPPFEEGEERFEPRVTGVAESLQALETIERLRAAHMPDARIVYTVSPVRFRATFRPMSALVANSASKAIVRAAMDEFLRAHEDLIGKTYFYFPSYEIVREFFVDPYADNIHVHHSFSDVVIDVFARNYTTLPSTTPPIPVPAGSEKDAGEYLAELEKRADDLQDIADQRALVIDDLKQACDERLALIERLNADLVGRNA